ncbi:MAG: hypothetical protein N4A48_07045 [Tepidibacter sp.]|jgi:hypothetical protein|uniref:hypothetical protein n=1 Tax=Tepidibacter sp. TaxID=2529387 RepID=UPI0025DF3339|nr:hypothetical protein [Tepidibacter sp.]MCT4508505.1 hypothetical protein [Tepidibacter sp.]
MKRKLNIVGMLLGILTAITLGTLPLIRMVVSPNASVLILTVGVVFFALAMVLIIVSMLLSPQILLKLAALPVTYVIVMIGYMLYKLNVYNIFKMMLGAEVVNPEQVFSSTASVGSLSMFLHVGVWICCIPLIVMAIIKSINLKKGKHQDFSNFDTAKGFIVKVKDTNMRINKTKIYKISLKIHYSQQEKYEVTKEFLVPAHMLHVIAIGNEVDLKINPKKKKDVYIKSEYGIL